MKILSRMLSKKVEPQKPASLDIDEERLALDDAGRVNLSRDPMFSNRKKAAAPRTEEPEVAGNGWAENSDWDDDDWDDDEDWGDDELSAMDIEERRRTQDKEHLKSEIREAMVSVSHVQPEERRVTTSRREVPDWSEDEDFGRRARARSQLTAAAADEAEDRILEKTENQMSDRETSRRRSAMAHMKVAAAATKADRVLRHVASRDPSGDPEEQSPYRDDLAKVVRPSSKSRPISRQVSRPNAPSPVWDQGAGDEDAALFAASADGMSKDPAPSIEDELSAAEAQRLARAPAELSEDDFADDDFATRRRRSEFPSSRFVEVDEEEDEQAAHTRNAFLEDDDMADDDLDAPDEEDDFAPRPSSAVAEAVAFANAPDEEPEEQPEAEVRKKIWEMADQVKAEVGQSRSPVSTPSPVKPELSAPAPEQFVEVASAVVSGRAGRSAGRVKTRLLGFQAEQGPSDIFASRETLPEANPASASTQSVVTFPAGWIVVVDGPGRGASFTLHNGVSQIGRGDDQTVRLDFGDTSISRNNHAAVAYDDEQGKFYLGHGGKSNLVRLNGKPVLSTEEMSNGDQIRIGETTLKFIALCGEDFTWAGSEDSAKND
jgi:hypothetical protein